MTQRKEILHYLRTHKKGLTSKEAYDRFGATRLSGQIYALKKQGYNIISENKKVKTRYGHTHIAVYRLGGADGAD